MESSLDTPSQRHTRRPSHKAGGVPIILPFFGDLAASMLDLIDGLILTGGADIDPARFGDDEIHPKTYDILPDRDEAEIELTRGALSRDMPILGICRGIQVLNVAMGGTLYQDVPDQFSAEIEHRQHEEAIPADRSRPLGQHDPPGRSSSEPTGRSRSR